MDNFISDISVHRSLYFVFCDFYDVLLYQLTNVRSCALFHSRTLINLFVYLFYLLIPSVRLEGADVSCGCLQDPVCCAMHCLYLLHLLHLRCLSVRITFVSIVRP
jgi:hypothetical protein